MDYGLFLAKVVKVYSDRDDSAIKIGDKLGVQILPQMENIPAEACPIWTYFFRDEYLLAEQGDLVWVICDNNYSNGYILGLANFTTFQPESFERYSIPTDLKKIISEALVSLKASTFNFTNLKITFWNKDSIHMVERSTGGLILAFRNGSLYIFRPDEMTIKIGENIIRINKKDISLVGNTIKLQSGDVELGNNPIGNVLKTVGTDATTAEPSKFVKA